MKIFVVFPAPSLVCRQAAVNNRTLYPVPLHIALFTIVHCMMHHVLLCIVPCTIVLTVYHCAKYHCTVYHCTVYHCLVLANWRLVYVCIVCGVCVCVCVCVC